MKEYNSVYNDDEELWFRLVFQQTCTKERHILAQAAYWIDSIGGGKLYHGGLGRLKFHHSYNARHVMNSTGASRWMYHMKVSIIKNRHHFVKDPRILPCIVLDFLKTKMQSYANFHGWELDEKDFQIEDYTISPS